MSRGVRMALIAAVLPAAACTSGLPPVDQVQPAPVPGTALPYNARVMVAMGEGELKRKMIIQISRYQSEETDVAEGRILAETARTLLGKAFKLAAVNDPASRPHLVVRPMGKTSWAQLDGKLHVGCAMDAWTADGAALGNFAARWDGDVRTDYRSDLGPGYAQCLKKAMDAMLASPAMARLAGQGFRDPNPKAAEEWMRGLGPLPALR